MRFSSAPSEPTTRWHRCSARAFADEGEQLVALWAELSESAALRGSLVAERDGTWMTGQLIYRDLWWRHDAAGLRDPLLAELEETLR